MSDPSRIGNALEVWDILTDGIRCERAFFYAIFAILFGRYGLSIGFAEIPRFDGNPVVGDDLTIGHIHETSAVRTPLLVSVSEILLEFIRIVGTVVCLPRELAVLGFAVEVDIRASSDEDGFDLLIIISVRDLSKTSEVIFERELVHDNELSVLVDERYLPSEGIVIHGSARIPRWFARPVRDGDELGFHLYFAECVSFLADHERDLIVSARLKREIRILLQDSGMLSECQMSECIVS